MRRLAALALAITAGFAQAQSPAQNPAQTAPASTQDQAGKPQIPATAPPTATPDGTKPEAKKKAVSSDTVDTGKPLQADKLHAQRKAAKLYLAGVRLMEKQRPEQAWKLLKQAAELDPGNSTYAKAAELARQTAVTQLVQQSSREHNGGASQDSTKLLQEAQSLDANNPIVLEHINELADAAANKKVGRTASETVGAQSGRDDLIAGGPIELEPKNEKHSFHLRTNQRQIIEQVFRAYGIEPSLHESVQSKQARLDIDDATFAQAKRTLEMLTRTFSEPLDPHRVIVAQDTRENRTQFQHLPMETIYLGGLNDKELAEAGNLAKNVFDAQQSTVEPTAGTLTVRAPLKTLTAFNSTMRQLEDGRSQVDLNVKVIQLGHQVTRETGTTFLQQTSVYNVSSEVNSLLSQNQALVQQVIAAGLVPNANTLANQIAILAILIASGQLTGTPFSQGFLPFGGGLTQSIVTTSPVTLTMSLNSSDTRMLDDIHLQLADQEDGTFKIGQRYPIQTSSYSSVALPAIATISPFAAAQTQTIPQIQYEDIGLTFKATPKVMRSQDVALTIDLKIASLGGASLNDIPVLNSQQVSGVITVKSGETAVLVSDLSRTQSRALSGNPGIADIPGLQDISDITKNDNVARLLILVTPYIVRNMQEQGHGPMLMLDKSVGAH